MKIVNKLMLILLVSTVWMSCKDQHTSSRTAIETEEISFTKEGSLTFYDTTGQQVQQINIEVAISPYEQQTGLMYRKEMKTDQGMLFIYEQERARPNFYMKNTYIPLDLIYISSERRIVDFNENAQPLDQSLLPSEAPAQYVLEVNAGMVQKWGLQLGDSVSFKVTR